MASCVVCKESLFMYKSTHQFLSGFKSFTLEYLQNTKIASWLKILVLQSLNKSQRLSVNIYIATYIFGNGNIYTKVLIGNYTTFSKPFKL